MYTQCPKCQTYFQVTAEHLKVAQGNVRCGQCSNVFSALGNLSEIPPQQAAKAAAQQTKQPATAAQTTAAQPKQDSQGSVQSKLTSAIAAIQALNQSSQRILSQGRKNYVTQLQQNTRSNRNIKPEKQDNTNASRPKPVQTKPAASPSQVDKDFDFDQAMAAVDNIDIDEEILTESDSAAQLADGLEDAESISAMLDDLPISEEDLAKALASEKKKASPAQSAPRREVRKSPSINDDEFEFSDLELPAEDDNRPAQAAKKQRQPLPRKQQSRLRKKLGDNIKTRARKQEKVVKKPPRPVTQHIVAEPDVIIENNIPTLAIPKQLLEDFNQDNQINPAHYRSMITWGLLSLLLMFVFLGQAIYFKHNELGQVSSLRPYIEMFCRHASCELTMQSDIGMIELLGQDIRSHPKNKHALLVSATIINNASFTQPYPGLRLSFSDMNGEKVASRNFLPKDYLPKKSDLDKGMESNIPIQIELEIVDPGKNAVNFEFDFFSI